MPSLHPAQIIIPLEPWDIRNRVAKYFDYAKANAEWEDQAWRDWAAHFIITALPSAPEPFPVIINDIGYTTSIFDVANRRRGFGNIAICYAYADNEHLPSVFFVMERNTDNHWFPKNYLLPMTREEFIQLDIGERYTLLLAAG